MHIVLDLPDSSPSYPSPPAQDTLRGYYSVSTQSLLSVHHYYPQRTVYLRRATPSRKRVVQPTNNRALDSKRRIRKVHIPPQTQIPSTVSPHVLPRIRDIPTSVREIAADSLGIAADVTHGSRLRRARGIDQEQEIEDAWRRLGHDVV